MDVMEEQPLDLTNYSFRRRRKLLCGASLNKRRRHPYFPIITGRVASGGNMMNWSSASAPAASCTPGPSTEEMVEANKRVAMIPQDRLEYRDEDGDSLLMMFVVKEMKLALIEALLARYRREGLVTRIINAPNNLGQTPVYMATCLNQAVVVRKLMEFGADVNQQAHTGQCSAKGPLHCAAARGDAYVGTLDQLLESPQVDINQTNYDGKTPLICAIQAHGSLPPNRSGEIIQCKNIIELLVRKGANVNLGDRKSGKTSIHYAVESKDFSLVSGLFGLIKSNHSCLENNLGKYINTTAFDGNTSLHIAVGQQMELDDHKRLVRLLMQNGADPGVRNHSRHTPKDLAKNSEIQNIVRGQPVRK